MDIVTTLRQWRDVGSKSDRSLADVILADIDAASRASIAELAEKADVSEPTVTRFCRSLGFDGVREFKHTLTQVLALGSPYFYPDPIKRDEADGRIGTAIMDGAERAMALARDTVDMAQMLAIAERIIAARQVILFGSGGVSSMGAIELQSRLFRLGIPVASYTDGQLQRMAAAVSQDGTIVIALSVSGEATSLVESLTVARQYGAFTVALTPPGTSLSSRADEIVSFIVPSDNQVYKPTAGRYALLSLIDVIATVTAERIGPDVLEGLRRVRGALTGINTSDPTSRRLT